MGPAAAPIASPRPVAGVLWPPVRRRLLNLLTALSLLLCVAVASLWARSRQTADILSIFRPWHMTHVVSSGGQLACVHWHRDPVVYRFAPSHTTISAAPTPPRPWWRTQTSNVLTHVDALGVYFGTGAECRHLIVVPYWLPCLLSGGLGAVALLRFLHLRQRVRQGRCRRCGYDLRATPGRCPECGTDPTVVLAQDRPIPGFACRPAGPAR